MGGRKCKYEFVGMMQFDGKGESECLNFTHRATLGGGDNADEERGNLGDLAKQQLDMLKQKYASVFETPTYPVDRSDCVN